MLVIFPDSLAPSFRRFGLRPEFLLFDDPHTELAHARPHRFIVSGRAIKFEAQDAGGGRCGFQYTCDLFGLRFDCAGPASGHRFHLEQQVPESLVEFHSGSAGQCSNVTDRQLAGIEVDADLTGCALLLADKVRGLNSVVRSQQVTESSDARIASIRHCGQHQGDFNPRLLNHACRSMGQSWQFAAWTFVIA